MPEADYILLAEDDATIAEVVKAYLTEAGYRGSLHELGQEALEQARKERPLLVVLDLSLPISPVNWSARS